MDKLGYEFKALPATIQFRVIIPGEKDDESFRRRCDEVGEELKISLGPKAVIESDFLMIAGQVFLITVPYEERDVANEKANLILSTYFPKTEKED